MEKSFSFQHKIYHTINGSDQIFSTRLSCESILRQNLVTPFLKPFYMQRTLLLTGFNFANPRKECTFTFRLIYRAYSNNYAYLYRNNMLRIYEYSRWFLKIVVNLHQLHKMQVRDIQYSFPYQKLINIRFRTLICNSVLFLGFLTHSLLLS